MRRSGSLGAEDDQRRRKCYDCGKSSLSADHLAITRVRTDSSPDSSPPRPTVRLGSISSDFRPISLSTSRSLHLSSDGEDGDGGSGYGCLTQRRDVNGEENRYAKRRYIIKEIIETERTYVGHLHTMLHGFMRPMEEALRRPGERCDLPTSEDVKALFAGIDTIYRMNYGLLKSLEGMTELIECGDDHDLQLGDAFLDVTSSFKFYSTFVNGYHLNLEALGRVEKTLFYKTLARETDRSGSQRTLSSLIVTPIQRIPRYVLLLRDLLDQTPFSHPDCVKLSTVLTDMKEVADYINTEKSKFDSLTFLYSLSHLISGLDEARSLSSSVLLVPGRTFIKEGMMGWYDELTTKVIQRYFFLFSDVLLMTRPKRGSTISLFNRNNGSAPKYRFCGSIRLQFARIDPSPESLGLEGAMRLSRADGASWVLQPEKELRDAWLDAFGSALPRISPLAKRMRVSSFPTSRDLRRQGSRQGSPRRGSTWDVSASRASFPSLVHSAAASSPSFMSSSFPPAPPPDPAPRSSGRRCSLAPAAPPNGKPRSRRISLNEATLSLALGFAHFLGRDDHQRPSNSPPLVM